MLGVRVKQEKNGFAILTLPPPLFIATKHETRRNDGKLKRKELGIYYKNVAGTTHERAFPILYVLPRRKVTIFC